MEMNGYQKKVIKDLTRYLQLLNETRDYAAAFRLFWQEQSAPSLGHYQDIMPGVPNLCFKVPTGGGKTFLALKSGLPQKRQLLWNDDGEGRPPGNFGA